MTTLEQAKAIKQAMNNLAISATDADASKAVLIYPKLKEDNNLIEQGTRINWNGTLKRAAVDLWDTKENNPDNAPNLWEDINYRAGHRIIPEDITVGLAFARDELGWWGDVLYRSIIDSNIWTPDAFPGGWEIYEQTPDT